MTLWINNNNKENIQRLRVLEAERCKYKCIYIIILKSLITHTCKDRYNCNDFSTKKSINIIIKYKLSLGNKDFLRY